MVGSKNRDHHRNHSCRLVEIGGHPIRLASAVPMSVFRVALAATKSLWPTHPSLIQTHGDKSGLTLISSDSSVATRLERKNADERR